MKVHTIVRNLVREAYARNGNVGNPTLEFNYSTELGTHSRLRGAKAELRGEFGPDCSILVVDSFRAAEAKRRKQ